MYSFRTERLNDDGLRCPGRFFDYADLVDRLAGRAQQLGGALGVRGGGDENHADAAIEHALHLLLGDVARHGGVGQSGVRNLAANFLGFRIPKGNRTSNWAARRLSPAQITYAATDAWACRELYLRFKELQLL